MSQPTERRLTLAVPGDGAFDMNEWSFSQLCQLSSVSKDTVSKLSPETASRVFGADFIAVADKGQQLRDRIRRRNTLGDCR